MSIWTKLRDAGFGGAIGDALAALVRAWSGRGAGEGERSVAFTMAMIALSAKMAKADGAVSPPEIEAFSRLFHVPENERDNILRVFNVARQSVAGFEAYARDVARMFVDRPGVLEDVLDGLFSIAVADGTFTREEEGYLARVAEIFGFSEGEFQRIAAAHLEEDPYKVLGVAPDCGDEELKRTYRRLMQETHPDKVLARGVPAEFVPLATAKAAAVNKAYEAIAARRARASR